MYRAWTWIHSCFTIYVHHERCKWQFSILVWKIMKQICVWFYVNYRNRAWTGFHNLKLKWNVILWNAKNCFGAWIFRKCEFIDHHNRCNPKLAGCLVCSKLSYFCNLTLHNLAGITFGNITIITKCTFHFACRTTVSWSSATWSWRGHLKNENNKITIFWPRETCEGL